MAGCCIATLGDNYTLPYEHGTVKRPGTHLVTAAAGYLTRCPLPVCTSLGSSMKQATPCIATKTQVALVPGMPVMAAEDTLALSDGHFVGLKHIVT